jgi:hypothetical protein
VQRHPIRGGGLQYPNDPRLVTHPIYKGALRTLADVWPCPWALAIDSAAKSRRAGDHPRNRSPFDIAWIGYLSAPLAANLKPPPELAAEPTPGGGVILSGVQAVIDQTNRDHVRRARLLERIVIERVGVTPRPDIGPGPY